MHIELASVPVKEVPTGIFDMQMNLILYKTVISLIVMARLITLRYFRWKFLSKRWLYLPVKHF